MQKFTPKASTCTFGQIPNYVVKMDLSSRAKYNREAICNAQIMYSECYTEYDEPDIYDMLEAVSLDEDTIGAECELLALVEFGALPFEYLEDY